MDPYNHQRASRDDLNLQRSSTDPLRGSTTSPGEATSDSRGSSPDPGGQTGSGSLERQTAAADRQPQHSSGFTLFPPNQRRRQEVQTMAQRGEETLQKVRELNRVQTVHIHPQRLGGGGSLAEAREKTIRASGSIKMERKLKKEEMDRRRRQEEEEELQRMKDRQRQKAERLEEKNRQEERRRREELRADHLRATESFLQSLKGRRDPDRLPSSGATQTSSRGEDVENRKEGAEPKTTRDVQLDHQRVNAAFLDKLEGRGREKTMEDSERFCLSPKEQNPAGHSVQLEADQTGPDWTEDEEAECPDYCWALMKLARMFPNYSEDVLQDILDQCGGEYQTACDLLTV